MERVYVVPIKKGWIKVPRWRRAKKAIEFLKRFAIRHMKGEEVYIDNKINQMIWKRGSRNPPRKIRVLMKKEDKKVFVLPFVEKKEGEEVEK